MAEKSNPAPTHNTGSVGDRRAAMEVMSSYAQSIIVVAVTTLAFTVGLLSTKSAPHQVWALQVGWVALLVSVLFSFIAIGQYASQLAEGNFKARQGSFEVYLLIGFLALMAGLSLVTLFGFNNVGGK